jgi:uncharacterized protein (TIGR02246 family)
MAAERAWTGAADASGCVLVSTRNCGFWLPETTSTEKEIKLKEKEMTIQEKTMKTSQIYRADSAPQAPKSALGGLMQVLGLTLLACTLVLGVTGSASAAETQDEAAVRALGDDFAKAFVQKNAEVRASLFAENGTFVTPQGNFLQGRVAMVNDFGQEAQAVIGNTRAAFSNYRIRFINPDVAVADALLTLHNVNGPDGTIIPVIPINFFYVAVRHGGQWLIEDGRAHFAPAPPNGMSDHGMTDHGMAAHK